MGLSCFEEHLVWVLRLLKKLSTDQSTLNSLEESIMKLFAEGVVEGFNKECNAQRTKQTVPLLPFGPAKAPEGHAREDHRSQDDALS